MSLTAQLVRHGRNFLLIALMVMGLSSVSSVPAQAATGESITNFAVRASLSQDRHLVIQETIDYSFGESYRHGLLRVLPEIYRRHLLRYNLHYAIKDVTMDDLAVPWETERQGSDLVIRVGSASKLVKGTHRYTLVYETDRAINDFSDTHELYWNVTGNEWQIPIAHASFEFIGPSVQRQACYTGREGSKASACSFGVATDTQALVAQTLLPLEPYEGLTTILEFPRSALVSESVLTTIGYYLRDNLSLLLPLLLCVLMFFVWLIWGRDPRGRGVIIPQYEAPDGISPALMSTLLEEKVSPRALTATLLDIARRGYARIELIGKNPEEPDKILFTRLPGSSKVPLLPFEEKLMTTLLDGEMEVNLKRAASQSQWQAYKTMTNILYTEIVTRGWFKKNPDGVRGGWLGIACIIGILAFFVGAFSYIFVALVIGFFGWLMPRVTREGAEMRERVLGFKRFLTVTEKQRLAFSDAPAKRPEQFAEFLPAAVALGVEKEWSKQFEGMTLPPPEYIHGAGLNWTSLTYVHTMNHLSHSVAAGMVTQTRGGSGGSGFSGGGGSSGGGFGGGGGGSW